MIFDPSLKPALPSSPITNTGIKKSQPISFYPKLLAHRISATVLWIFRSIVATVIYPFKIVGHVLSYPFKTKKQPSQLHQFPPPPVSVPKTPKKANHNPANKLDTPGKNTPPLNPDISTYSPPKSPVEVILREPLAQKMHDLLIQVAEEETNKIYNKDIKSNLETLQKIAPWIPKLTSTINILIDSDVADSTDVNIIKNKEAAKHYVAQLEISLSNMFPLEPVATRTPQENLIKIAKETIDNNIEFIVGAFSDRLVELTTSLSFKDAFDTMLKGVVYEGIKAQMVAENEVAAKKESLKAAKERESELSESITTIQAEIDDATQIFNNDASQIKQKTSAQTTKLLKEQELAKVKQLHAVEKKKLDEVQSHGGEDQYFEHVYLDTFANVLTSIPGTLPACDPRIKALIDQSIILQSQENLHGADVALKNVELDIYSSLTDKIMGLLLAKKTITKENGSTEEVDFVKYIFRHLRFPDQISEIQQLFVNLKNTVLSKETELLLEKINNTILVVVEGVLEKHVRLNILDIVKTCCQKVIVPKELNKLLAEEVLPLLNEQMMTEILKKILRTHVEEVTPLFYTLLTETNQADKPGALARLHRHVVTLLDKACQSENSKKFLDFNQNTLVHEILQSEINEIKDFHKESNHSQEEIIIRLDIIQAYFCQSEVQAINDPIFGDLAFDLVFEVGKWPLKGPISSMLSLKTDISLSITQATSDIKYSNDFFARQIVEALENFLKPPKKPPQNLSPIVQNNPVHIKNEIEKTASLIYDKVMLNAWNTESYAVANYISYYGVKSYLGGSEKEIATLIETIYTKTLQREITNLNFIVRLVDTFFDALQKRSTEVEREKLQKIDPPIAAPDDSY